MTLVAAVGRDAFAAEALAELEDGRRRARAPARRRRRPASRVIQVDAGGETTIAVAPGRERASSRGFELPEADAVLCQLEIPDEAVLSACGAGARALLPERGAGAAGRGRRRPDGREPARARGSRPAADGLVALTLGAEGAVLLEDGDEVARAAPPRSRRSTARPPATRSPPACSCRCSRAARREEALRRACAAGALAASRFGAQPSLPTAAEVDEILAR